MDPAAAVAIVVVPLVNIVGIFLSWGRLPWELNWLAKSAAVKERAPQDLGLAAAIVAVCTVIPFVGVFFGLLSGFVLVPALMISCSRVADAIERRLGMTPEPSPVDTAEALHRMGVGDQEPAPLETSGGPANP